jgi:acetyl esterase/lipase
MRPSTVRRSVAAAALAAVALGSLTPALAGNGRGRDRGEDDRRHGHGTTATTTACTGSPASVQTLNLTVAGQPAWGLYAYPSTAPKGIVVFGHGYGHTAESWRKHITDTATRDGVIAVAMDYRGQVDTPGTPLPSSRGWQVIEGAADSIAAAQYFNGLCPDAATIVMYGVSMGGNTAGLAVAAKATRAGGAPLFDYWFDIEGATSVVETYTEARALAGSGNAFAKNAVEDIEHELGGPIESRPQAYLDLSVITHGDDIKASGVKGVVMVQGVDDGLVGYNQSPELYTRLRSLGIPVDFWTAVTRGSASEPGTTLDGYVTSQVPGFTSPFAGHASEASDTHIVGNAGFERLAALFSGTAPACRTGLLDGTLGFTETTPLTSPATC